MESLKGKTVLVTGSSRGIGASTAQYLAEIGMRVAITYSRSKDKAEEVFKTLKGDGHMMVSLDDSNEESVKESFNVISKEFGGL
ncbi:MAG: SDR family NAD(P)-dependent oxidoreductase, partial [Bdellovibrionales bacterium]|nr:SDR family NAD(P)-dependent oxidoreductase [Bdellovibrionales bacterium]NQZ20336.1 SDR family NAD(P)-dependent oxidoreductase [Bdellovibrionales bacterium]